MKVAIIDLASIFYRLWHINRDEVEFKIIGILKTLQYEKIIVCVDAPPYKRKESYPEYKANRDIPDPELIGMLEVVKKKILREGFTIAMLQGWEADDVVASLYKQHTEIGDEVFVYGSDKDLLQCCNLIDYFDGTISTPESKFGLSRNQIVDYLALKGDSTDNIIGVNGIGDKTAVALLTTFGSVDGIYDSLEKTPEKFTKEKIKESLIASKEQVYKNMSLIELNDSLNPEFVEQKIEAVEPEPEELPKQQEQAKNETQAIVRSEVPFKHSLEPMGLDQAYRAAKMFNTSGLYPKFKGPEQIMMIVMRGRELGIGATTSLDLIEMIQGKPTMKAAGMLALVRASSSCEYFVFKETDSKKCTCVTKRKGDPCDSTVTFTIEDAQKMGLTGKDNWIKQPAVMLQWRACARLIRMVYPDLVNGIYATEEMEF